MFGGLGVRGDVMAFPLAVMLALGLPLVLCAWWLARRGRYGSVTPFCGLLFLVSLFIVSLPNLAQSVLTFFLALLWLGLRPRASVVLTGALVAIAVPLGMWCIAASSVSGYIDRLRERYPVVSLADRLAYEAERVPTGPSFAPRPRTVDHEMAMVEESIEFRGLARAIVLERLHDDTLADFSRAPGFGVTRTSYVFQRYTRRREPVGVISQPSIDYVPEATSPQPPQGHLADTPKNTLQRRDLYRQSLTNFLDGEAFGFVKDIDTTVGFESHRFTQEFDTRQTVGEPPYRLARLELVSLLKHERPVVYVSEHLPNMDELRDVPTRALTAFEGKSLVRLRRDENLVTEDAGNLLHMLGAVRASETCMKCHSVRRGELLGAFSYELVPAGGAARATVEEGPAF